jgi:hypothetical protein
MVLLVASTPVNKEDYSFLELIYEIADQIEAFGVYFTKFIRQQSRILRQTG